MATGALPPVRVVGFSRYTLTKYSHLVTAIPELDRSLVVFDDTWEHAEERALDHLWPQLRRALLENNRNVRFIHHRPIENSMDPYDRVGSWGFVAE